MKLLLLLVSLVFLQTKAIAKEQFFQLGYEFDTNVYKNFGSKKEDSVIRAHYLSRQQIFNANKLKGQFTYQQGVKKFIQENNQDQLIQSFALSSQYKHDNFTLEWTPSFKVLIERKSDQSSDFDIEENYILPSLSVRAAYRLKKVQFVIDTGARLFQFYANDDFSNVSEWMKLGVQRRVDDLFDLGLSYKFSLEQFLDVDRQDNNHDISFFIEYPFKPNLRLSYTFADSNSSINRFSFVKHQFMFRLFYDLGERPNGIPYLSFYATGILQWNEFPSIFDFDDEGQRFLLTESEGQTFNSFVGKISYYMSERQHVELKYTRFSNDLSSQQTDYNRSLYYLGLKQSF